MPNIVFSNWKQGLDVRRSELTTQAGALLQAQDLIINEGAEIENRYAFTSVSAAAASTFGLETITTGLLTFGSIVDPGGWTSPVSYQRLQHPAVAEGGASVAMTSVICSCSFANQAWVVAKFADGGVYAYYNGTVVPAFRNGQVLTGLVGNDKIAQQLANTIAAVNGMHVTAITNNAGAYYFDIYSDAGLNYAPNASVATSAAGTISAVQRLNATQGVAEILASGYFAVWGGATGTVTSIKVNNIEILGSIVTYTSDNLTTANLLVTTINNFISTPQYSASVGIGAYANFVYIAATAGSGATPNNYVVKITTTGDFIVDNTFFQLPVSTSNSATSIQVQGANLVSGQAYSGAGAFAQAVTAGLTYTWTKGASDTNLVNGASTYTVTTTFVASGATVTLHGTNSANITATLILLTEILGATVSQGAGSMAAWSTAIAAQINTFGVYNAFATSASGFATVYISAKVRSSNDSFPLGVLVTLGSGTVTGNTGSGNPSSNQGLVANSTPLYNSQTVRSGGNQASANFTCSVSGGITPYTYNWVLLSQSGLTGLGVKPATIVISSPTKSSTSMRITTYTSGVATFQCQVTDSSATPITAFSNSVPFYVTIQ